MIKAMFGRLVVLSLVLHGCAAPPPVLVPDAGNLFMLSSAQSRSISPENFSGGKGMGARMEVEDGIAKKAAAHLGKGWKVNPNVHIEPGTTFVLGEARGPGIINHIWMTLGLQAEYRSIILRIYWDDETTPSVEVPVGDFFAAGWGRGHEPVIDSAMVAVNPGNGFNSFWPMPFREKFRMTLENRGDKKVGVYYQIDYALTEVPRNAAYFHAQFRLSNRLKPKTVHTLVDGIAGRGHYVGTYLAHGAFSPGWWGEGEVKFYMDGDDEYPTIVGTGEEDYFLGAHAYSKKDASGKLHEISYASLYAGFHALAPIDMDTDYFRSDIERRHGQYRWHVPDPIRFQRDLKVTIQSLGWADARPGARAGDGVYLSLEDYLASVAFWYQTEPHAPFPVLPDEAALAVPPLAAKANP